MATLAIELYRRELQGKLCRRVARGENPDALIEGMARIASEAGVQGIAAPQVGTYVQLALVRKPWIVGRGRAIAVRDDHDSLSTAFETLVNPRIVNLGGRDLLDTESCLSLPPVDVATARVWRSEIAHVRTGTAQDPEADELRIYKGTAARWVQHEIDHLEGIFFIDRCQPVGRGIVLRRYEQHLRGAEQGTEGTRERGLGDRRQVLVDGMAV